jgi:nucleotide-binding universal stress UspA family protein
VKKILLAADGSEHALRAATTAGELSAAFHAPVDVVHVVSDVMSVTAGAVHEYARIEQIAMQQRELLQTVGSDTIRKAANAVRSAGGTVGGTDLLMGSAAHEIVRYADHHGCDCIVMGRRGLGNITGLLMGSVSHKVAHLTERTLVTTE